MPNDLTNLSVIKNSLAEHGIFPSRRLGQNFICNSGAIKKIIEAAMAEEKECLEIGPGLGALTSALSDIAKCVTAVEVCEKLEGVLEENLAELKNVKIIFQDFLKLDPKSIGNLSWVVVSNLPYSISTPALFRFIDGGFKWERMIFTLQAEVGERLAASPRTKEYGALSIAVQASCKVELLNRFPSSFFWPRPKIESVLVRLTPSENEKPLPVLRKVLRTAFSSRRKTMRNAMKGIEHGIEALSAAKLDPNCRPEEIPVPLWIELARKISELENKKDI
ncbi:TPA: ribosomal RNA small subunit methyltransferase A [bacterium]|nr:MAG: ribosomal RNA small subunit methyltransferase A [Candidatus Hydrogenedentes bacterium CG1_02_42_14]PIU48579.1 MAG: ribosomal RNA small subunit methyltransferase A [Candidatus Hydrogenedentes bacterium CG07_land_8_20_14_0_80_42_17]HBW47671.1 ribosomal RNA small subunit methyltransferase A [bacterium]